MYEESPWKGTGPGAGAKAAFGFMVVLTVVSAAFAVVSAVDGDAIGALGFAAGSLFLGHLVGFGVNMWWRPRRAVPRAAVAGGAVTFRYSGWTSYWMGSFMVLMVCALVLIGSSLLVGGGTPGLVAAGLAFAGAAFFGWYAVRLAFGGRGHLRLSPTVLEHRGPGFTHRLRWDSVAGVHAAVAGESPLIVLQPAPSAPVDVTFTWTSRFGGRKGLLLPSMAIRGVWLADDPVIVHHTVLHYHANPEHRVELASGAALDRIRRRRFLLR